MKKMPMIWFLLILVGTILTVAQPARAGVAWEVRKQVNLEIQPLDTAVSFDGKLLYLLVPGEIMVYSVTEDKVAGHIPLEGDYDRLSHSPRDNSLFVTSSKAQKLKIIEAEIIYTIDSTGLPIKGPADAPVTIAIFDDYQ